MHVKTLIVALSGMAVIMACQPKENHQEENTMKVVYPETAKVDSVDEYFGVKVSDPYRWLEDDNSEATKAWVKAQNDLTFGYLNQIPCKDTIAKRLTSLFNYPRLSAPHKVGDYFFYSKNDGLQNQSVTFFKKGENGEEQVFLDPNTMSDDGTVTADLAGESNDNKYMAIAINRAGSDWSEIKVKDVASNSFLEDVVERVKFSGASWFEDGFFYSRFPEPKDGRDFSAANEFHSIYYHKLGTAQSEDVLVYKNEKEPKLYYGVGLTEHQEYMFLYESEGTEGVNIYYAKPSLNPEWKVLVNDFTQQGSVVDFKNGHFLFLTDKNTPNYKLVAVDPQKPTEDSWVEIIPEKSIKLNSVTTGGGKMFASYLENASTKVYEMDFEGKNIKEVILPTFGSAGGFAGKDEDAKLYYGFTSFTYPYTIFSYEVSTGKSEVFYQPEVQFNPSDYEAKQVWYPSKDSTMVSMFIVYKKGIVLDGTHPTLLYGYGGFNIDLTPSFSVSNIVLLENGGVYAMANLRGGGEYGQEWHKAGMKTKKQNVFDDFISAGEYLINEKFTSKDYLAIAGGSNGGLLVGACMTQRPDLFKVAFPAVGVMDMLRFHKFTVGWGWTPEYGSSEESEEMFKYLYAYSPLHNIKANTDYPATLITTADHDDRVVPAHSFKFAATLQTANSGKNPTLIRIETNAGHGAGTPISKTIEQQADKWAFMFYNMGIKPYSK
ncbi:MAG: S9 family peptidase [Bacteroidales bacterium]|nr:S9 family peptidase [Bacteroidales bacterium]